MIWIGLAVGFVCGAAIGFGIALDTRPDPISESLPKPRVLPAAQPTPLPRSRVLWPYQNSQN